MINTSNFIDSGVYIVSKQPNARVRLDNKLDNTTSFVDYFFFEKMLFNIFDQEKVDKILMLIRENNFVLIDFDKVKAFKISSNNINYLKSFWSAYGSMNAINAAYNEWKANEQEEMNLDINASILEKYQSEEI